VASITSQLADAVTALINGARPYVGELTAIRRPLMFTTRSAIEDLQVAVVAGIRTSIRSTRNSWLREYPVVIIIDGAISTERNDEIDIMHEITEQMTEVLELSYKITIGSRTLRLQNISPETDDSGLTESQHLPFALTALYMDIDG